jgi:hypothetical protein
MAPAAIKPMDMNEKAIKVEFGKTHISGASYISSTIFKSTIK